MKHYLDALREIQEVASRSPTIKIGEILDKLAGFGSPPLLIIFSVPSCLPIPGISTVFGAILAFLGIKIMFCWHRGWPAWIREKSISGTKTCEFIQKSEKLILSMRRFFKPRLSIMIENPILYRINGLFVFICALFLMLPIPLTNALVALPILFIGLGLLYHDGLLVVIGQSLAILGLWLFVDFLKIVSSDISNL